MKGHIGSAVVVAGGTELAAPPVEALHTILAVAAATNGGERVGETSPRNCFAIKIAFPRKQEGFLNGKYYIGPKKNHTILEKSNRFLFFPPRTDRLPVI